MYSWQSKNLNVIPKCNEEFEDIKGVIRLRISKKNRQHKRPKEKEQTTMEIGILCNLLISNQSCQDTNNRRIMFCEFLFYYGLVVVILTLICSWQVSFQFNRYHVLLTHCAQINDQWIISAHMVITRIYGVGSNPVEGRTKI